MNKLLLTLIIGLFLLSIVIAPEALSGRQAPRDDDNRWDNVKLFDRDVGRYGTYYIKDSFLRLWATGKVKEIELISNTPRCSNDCEAVFNITLYKHTTLIDDKRYYDGNSLVNIKDQEFYIKTRDDWRLVDDYGLVCGEDRTGSNATIVNGCSIEKVGEHWVDYSTWEPLDLRQSYIPGDYQVKLKGSLNKEQSVDWQVLTSNIWTEEWAVWEYDENLIAYYRLETETNSTIDETQQNNGTNYGANLSTTDCIIGNCLQWLNPDTINLGTGTISPTSPPLSINMWVKVQQFSSIRGLIGGSTGEYAIYTAQTTGELKFGKIGTDEVASGAYLIPNTWAMVTVVYNTTDIIYYINGTEVGTPDAYTTTFGGTGIIYLGYVTAGVAYDGLIDEVGVWNRSLTASDVAELWNDGDGLPYSSTVIVTLNAPTDAQAFSGIASSRLTTFNCSADGGAVNITNITLYTNETSWSAKNITDNDDNQTITQTWNRTISPGTYVYNCYACNDYGTCSFADSNYSFSYTQNAFTENSQTYNAVTYETQEETFKINLTYDSSTYALQGILNYNGTNYTGSREGTGNYVNLTRTIEIPQGLGINTFFWYLGLTNSTDTYWYNSTSYNQTVAGLGFGICNDTNNVPYINFTIKDQLNGTLIDGTEHPITYKATFLYWAGNGTGEVYANYSYESINATNNTFAFCVTPANQTINVNLNSEFTASGYNENNYYLRNASLTNSSNNINLYLLETAEGTKFTITTYYGATTLNDGIVTISKYFIEEGNYKTTGIKETDEEGRFVDYLDLDQKYRFSVVKNGELLGVIDKTAICSASPCTLTLSISTALTDLWSPYYAEYSKNTVSNISYNDTSKIVTYNFLDITGLNNYFRLLVSRIISNTTESQTICDVYSYTSSGTLTCNMSSYSDGDFVARGYISRSPELLDKVLYFVLNNLKDSLGLMGIILSIGIIITVTFAFATMSRGNPAVIIVAFGFIFTLTKIMMLLPLSWAIVTLVDIVCIAIAFFVGT